MTADHILVTGGAGFIGSHIVDALLADPERRVTVLDRLSVGGSRANLEQHDGDRRFAFVLGDVNDTDLVRQIVGGVDAVIHAAAEAHVDRSIDEVRSFLETNLMGTQSVLEAVRAARIRMLMISTDEVYGAGEREGGRFTEDAPVAPRSPYALSKAAADLLCTVYRTTYGVDVTVVRGTNAYGPRQIERVIPTFTISALEGLPVPVYAKGEERREFLHVRDWARAVLAVFARGEPGVLYNIGGGTEISNLELAERIVGLVGANEDLITFVPDRPGHDFRYGVTDERVRGLGWAPEIAFDDGLAETVAWYRDHRDWLYRAHEVDVVTRPRPPQGVV
jgi:dTDP-glucose 4,6-dehydratase